MMVTVQFVVKLLPMAIIELQLEMRHDLLA